MITVTEQDILALYDEYVAAQRENAAAKKYPPKTELLPVPCTIQEYNAIVASNEKAKEEYDDKVNAAGVRYHSADMELFKAIPSNTWIHLPSRKISIGFSTGTWGGGCHALHVAKDGTELGPLPHTTFYP